MNRLRGYKSFNRQGAGSLMESIMPELRDFGFFFVKTGTPRLFYRLDTYLDYSCLFVDVDPQNRIYDELIPEHLHQKPRFDIDIELPRDPTLDYVSIDDPVPQKEEEIDTSLFQKCLDVLVDTLYKELPRLNLAKDVIVATSHGPDGDKYKVSGHVIIDNYCHLTSKEADFFGRKIVEQVPEELQSYFDVGIWSPNHCLRMIGNTKPNKTRYKTFQEKWNYRDKQIEYEYREPIRNENHKLNLQLEASLVTVARKCKVITVMLPEKNTSYQTFGDITDSQYESAVDLFNDWWNDLPGTRTGAFSTGKSEKSFIELIRKKSSLCPVCHKYPSDDRHTSIGAYLLVQGNIQLERELPVRFGCYRAKDKQTILIGTIVNTEIEEVVTFIKSDGTRVKEEYKPERGHTVNPKFLIARGMDPELAARLSQTYSELTEDTPIPIGGFIDDRERVKTQGEIKKENEYQATLHCDGPTLDKVTTSIEKTIPVRNPVIMTSDGHEEAPETKKSDLFSFLQPRDSDIPEGNSTASKGPDHDWSFLH